ncbi:MAG: M protein trans-acting positive regulator, partial [Enterococcus sp.]
VAIEHNYLIVKSIYQFMSDLKFVNSETFASQKQDHYDLIISSSLLIKNQTPNSNFFLWELGQDDEQYIILYKRLRKIFNEKNK